MLRRSRRPLLLCLEQAYRPTLEDHVHRIAPMGAPVLINRTWYNILFLNERTPIMCRWCAKRFSSTVALSHEQPFGYLIHCLLVVLAWEQVSIAIHCDLQRSVTGESLYGLRRKPRLD